MRVVDLLVRGLDLALLEVAQLAVAEQARADGAVADFRLAELMAAVAVAAVRIARRIVGEAQAVAGLGDALALLPVAHIVVVGGILDLRLLGFLDRLELRLRRTVVGRGADLHGLVRRQARLPFFRRGREGGQAGLDDGVDLGGRDGDFLFRLVLCLGLLLLLRERGAGAESEQGGDADGDDLHGLSPVSALQAGCGNIAALGILGQIGNQRDGELGAHFRRRQPHLPVAVDQPVLHRHHVSR